MANILAVECVPKAIASQGICPLRNADAPLFSFSEQGRFFLRRQHLLTEEDLWNYPSWTPCWRAGNRNLIN
jgi:hypothetical protein